MENAINLLWTGGWDSTFRFLQLILIEKRTVQPIYIMDLDRTSHVQEINVIKKVIKLLSENYYEQSKNILDVKFLFKIEPETDNPIKKYFDEFAKECHIGSQYLWIPSSLEKYNISEIEMSIEKSEDPASVNGTWLDIVIPLLQGTGHECKLDIENISDNKLLLFKYFRFPLINITKTQMANIAKENNFYSILKEAWFCHHPILNRPCGICRPCIIASESGQLTIHKPIPRFIGKSIKKLDHLTFILKKLSLKIAMY